MNKNDFTFDELVSLSVMVNAEIDHYKDCICSYKEYSSPSKNFDEKISYYEKLLSEYTAISEKIAYKRKKIQESIFK